MGDRAMSRTYKITFTGAGRLYWKRKPEDPFNRYIDQDSEVPEQGDFLEGIDTGKTLRVIFAATNIVEGVESVMSDERELRFTQKSLAKPPPLPPNIAEVSMRVQVLDDGEVSKEVEVEVTG